MSTLTQDLAKLRKFRLAYERAKDQAEKREREFKQWQDKCFERMEKEDVQGHKAGGVNFVPTETTYHVIQDRDKFLEWAESNDEALTEQRERKALLNQLVRERLDNGEGLPPGVGFYTRRVISQRAA